jgi:DNA mismatch repair protein MSH4
MEDAYQHATELSQEYDLKLDLKYDAVRQFYIKIPVSEIEDRPLPAVFTNVFRKKNTIECQTLELMKRNQKITISHQEVVLMSDELVQELTEEVRGHMSVLFKICESIAMLDMIAAFAQLVTTKDYGKARVNLRISISLMPS